jgi:phosphate uptake regulator
MACAAENAKIVLQGDPENIEAQDILREAKSKVRDMFQQAYSMKQSGDVDGASIIFKRIMEMTAPEDEYHAKAQKQLKHGND